MKRYWQGCVCGLCAGMLNGLLGAGGGMVLVPLMRKLTTLQDKQMFRSSVAILFPICIVSLLFAHGWESFSLILALPYLLGSIVGGFGAVICGKKIPSLWLHRGLGLLIIWGGIRYLW